MSAAGLGQANRSLRLAAAAEARLRALGVGHTMKFGEALLEQHIGRARAALGEDAARITWEANEIYFRRGTLE